MPVHRFFVPVVLAICVLMTASVAREVIAGQTSYLFSRVDFPGATNTDARDINIHGDIVGFYNGADGVSHGFHLAGWSYTIVVGTTAPIPSIQGGAFTTIDYPGATFTNITAANNHGEMVGTYRLMGDPSLHAFRLREGTFTNIDVPGAMSSMPRGLGNKGEVLYEAVIGGKTFAYILADGVYTNLEPPASFAAGTVFFSYSSGINERGTIVGRYDDTFHGANHNRGFTLHHGAYEDVFFPNSVSSAALGINDRNDLVGGYTATGLRHGFVLSHGVYTTLDVPGCTGTPAGGAVSCTTPWKINNCGRIVGFYGSGTTTRAGFLAIPSREDDGCQSGRP